MIQRYEDGEGGCYPHDDGDMVEWSTVEPALCEATRLLTTLRDSLAVQVRSDTLAQEIDAWLEQWRTP